MLKIKLDLNTCVNYHTFKTIQPPTNFRNQLEKLRLELAD